MTCLPRIHKPWSPACRISVGQLHFFKGGPICPSFVFCAVRLSDEFGTHKLALILRSVCSLTRFPVAQQPPLQDHGHSEPDAPRRQTQTSAQESRCYIRPTAAEGGGAENHDSQTQEAQFGQPQVRPRTAVQRQGGGGVYPWRGTQSAGTQRGTGPGGQDAGFAWR